MEAKARTTNEAHNVTYASYDAILYVGINMHLNSPKGLANHRTYLLWSF